MLAPPVSRLELSQLDPPADDSSGEHCWMALPARSFQVRAASYLKDGRKAPSAHGSELLAVELFRSPSAAYHVSKRPDSPAHTLAQRTNAALESVFVVNLILPAADGVYQLVFYYGLLRTADEGAVAFTRLRERFERGTDAFRNARLKLLPAIPEGPWVVQKAVASRPAILGKALRQRFHSGDGYMEVGVDCNSSPAAGRIVSLVKSYSRSLVVDLAFVIEAQKADELPERVLGCGRVLRISLEDDAVPRWPYEIEGEGEADDAV